MCCHDENQLRQMVGSAWRGLAASLPRACLACLLRLYKWCPRWSFGRSFAQKLGFAWSCQIPFLGKISRKSSALMLPTFFGENLAPNACFEDVNFQFQRRLAQKLRFEVVNFHSWRKSRTKALFKVANFGERLAPNAPEMLCFSTQYALPRRRKQAPRKACLRFVSGLSRMTVVKKWCPGTFCSVLVRWFWCAGSSTSCNSRSAFRNCNCWVHSLCTGSHAFCNWRGCFPRCTQITLAHVWWAAAIAFCMSLLAPSRGLLFGWLSFYYPFDSKRFKIPIFPLWRWKSTFGTRIPPCLSFLRAAAPASREGRFSDGYSE